MTVRTQGFCWHVHHDELIEWCYDYEGRARYIQTGKPKNEQEIRLCLFQPVKGNLPNEVIEARQALVKAVQACDEARQAYWQANNEGSEAWQAYGKARATYYKVSQAYEEAWLSNTSAIEELHAAECTNCPWDGHTIFPNT